MKEAVNGKVKRRVEGSNYMNYSHKGGEKTACDGEMSDGVWRETKES